MACVIKYLQDNKLIGDDICTNDIRGFLILKEHLKINKCENYLADVCELGTVDHPDVIITSTVTRSTLLSQVQICQNPVTFKLLLNYYREKFVETGFPATLTHIIEYLKTLEYFI